MSMDRPSEILPGQEFLVLDPDPVGNLPVGEVANNSSELFRRPPLQ